VLRGHTEMMINSIIGKRSVNHWCKLDRFWSRPANR
jgi:hypothetical protein